MPNYDPNYWIIRREGSLRVHYNRTLDAFGWPRLKAIAEKALKTCDVWNSEGVHRAEIGSLDTTPYIAFPIPHPDGGLIVCIETQASLEKNLNVKLTDLAAHNCVSDGQHKHEGK